MPSKRPESKLKEAYKDTAFKQQRLRSWQPLLTPKAVIPSFFVIGLIFIPIGIVLQMQSDAVRVGIWNIFLPLPSQRRAFFIEY
jgi:hypothetical protein